MLKLIKRGERRLPKEFHVKVLVRFSRSIRFDLPRAVRIAVKPAGRLSLTELPIFPLELLNVYLLLIQKFFQHTFLLGGRVRDVR